MASMAYVMRKSNKQNLAPSTMLQREKKVIKDKRRQYHKNKKKATQG